MKKCIALISALTVLSISALAMAFDFGGEYIEAEGIVYANEKKNPNAMRRIAIMDAYRYLAEQVDTIYVSTNSTVKNMRDLDEEINTKVEAALRGAKVIDVKREKDGSFHAIVRLYTHGVPNSLSSAVLNENVQIEDFPPPKFTNIVSVNYTGLIIDCRGQNLSTAISPAIKSADGTEIYAYKNIGYQTAVSNGIVAYSTSIDSGVERAGASPLVIKAVSISGNCDVVVSAEDADKILASNQSANFLGNCAVVLVR